MSRHKHAFSRPAISSGPVTRFDLLIRQAIEKSRAGEHGAAADLYRQGALLQPGNPNVHHGLGCCLQAVGQVWDAAEAFRKSIAIKPTAQAHIGLADALRQQEDHEGAMRHCAEALAMAPDNAEALVVRGAVLSSLGRFDEAARDLMAAVRGKPAHADARLTLGNVLSATGRFPEAIAQLQKARKLRPNHVPTLIALSEAHRAAGMTWDAFECIRKASELEPRNAVVYTNMAVVLAGTPMLEMAASAARLALDLSPNLWAAAFNLGMVLMTMGKNEEAIKAYARAVEIDPQKGEALFQLVKLHEQACDWEGLETARELALATTYRRSRHAVPFSVLSLTASPHEHLLSARVFAKTVATKSMAPFAPYEAHDPASRRLRIGYLSADFRVHPVADLIVEVLELHDEATVETFGYSIGADDRSTMRGRIIEALDHFRDLRELGDQDAARTIFADKIDVLVDLTGYTHNSRPGILAHRPAPIQVNFLGYPGTMGAPFVDYIIADRHVAPFEHQCFYDEKIVHLPHSYQPNDRKRPRLRRSEPRAMHGLPDDGFVFCCFNNTFKISSQIFDVWMRLLAAVPGSVLWLLKANDRVEATLGREAEQRGVSADRLVFAPRVAKERHLARVSLADLFLDTLLYNAHTTASEALWMGVPVVTLIGEAFPARVGASLLRALDLPDLVTETLAAYEAKALSLATDLEALAAINARLSEARNDAPLFDTPLFTRHLEAAYEDMTGKRRQGLPPAAFAVVRLQP